MFGGFGEKWGRVGSLLFLRLYVFTHSGGKDVQPNSPPINSPTHVVENGEFWSCEKDKKKHIFGLPGLGYCRQWCWGVGFSLDFIEALKMLENHEKPCFTFFAFLPPYIGVSGCLVSRNG